MRFNEERALEVFCRLAEAWRNREGFYAGLISPQQEYTPQEIRGNPGALAQWFFALAIPMRGGINSTDAFRFMRGLWERNSLLFDPRVTRRMHEAELISVIRDTARVVHELVNGTKRAGTLSYKLEEHVRSWIRNAEILSMHWEGDVRRIFHGVRTFEHAFRRMALGEAPALVGMRRKIFALLALWLQEFGLIHRFPLPLIVDFHAMRLLLEQEILLPSWKPLGPGQPKLPERKRPESLWDYPAVRGTEQFVNVIIMWSERFLAKHRLSAHDLSHALWFLSRELCASYFGNRSLGATGLKRALTGRLLTGKELTNLSRWPKEYQDPCARCPVEKTCEIRIPAGPYYDWGVLVNAGPHIQYPGRQPFLPGVSWRGMTSALWRPKSGRP